MVTQTPMHKTLLHHLTTLESLEEFFLTLNDENSGGTLQKDEEPFDPNSIVFQPDIEGNTPLHNAIRTNNTRVTDRLVQYLMDTDFDNHIRYINRKIPKLVELVPL